MVLGTGNTMQRRPTAIEAGPVPMVTDGPLRKRETAYQNCREPWRVIHGTYGEWEVESGPCARRLRLTSLGIDLE